MKNVIKKFTVLTVTLTLCLTMMFTYATAEAQAASTTHLKKASLTMTTGATYQQRLLTSNNKVISASKVTWSSNNSKVAKVSKTGKVTAVKQGTTTIKAKYGGKTYSFKVKVKNADLYYLQGATCVVGGKIQMYMWGAGGKIDVSKAKWSSSNKKILTVNSKGVVTGVSTGTATVYATYLNHKYSCKVSVEWTTLDNIKFTTPYSNDKALVYFNYTTNCREGVNVELGNGSELVKVFHKNQGSGNNRYASIYCYPNATGQVELKVSTVSEPNSYYLFKLNFKNGKFIGEGDLSEGSQGGNTSTITPPTYAEAGIPNLGQYGLRGLSIEFEGAINESTMSYVYNLNGTWIEAAAICANYRDNLVENYGWTVYKVEDTEEGGMMYTLYHGRYLLGMEWRLVGGQYQIIMMLLRG